MLCIQKQYRRVLVYVFGGFSVVVGDKFLLNQEERLERKKTGNLPPPVPQQECHTYVFWIHGDFGVFGRFGFFARDTGGKRERGWRGWDGIKKKNRSELRTVFDPLQGKAGRAGSMHKR